MTFVPIKDPIERISCMTSASYMDKKVLAAAFVESFDKNIVSIEVFSTEDPDRVISIDANRMRFKIPK